MVFYVEIVDFSWFVVGNLFVFLFFVEKLDIGNLKINDINKSIGDIYGFCQVGFVVGCIIVVEEQWFDNVVSRDVNVEKRYDDGFFGSVGNV